MKTRTIVFKEPIGRFEELLKQLRKCHPLRLETKPERDVLRKKVEKQIPSCKGIYVFYEGEKPLYVGRTDQMADRLLSHTRKPNANGRSSATFALIFAKYEFKKAHSVRHDLFSKELARELTDHSAEKMELWKEAVKRVKRMSVRVVEVIHPHEQAVFEVYAHEKLATPFNSFVNH